GTGIVLRAGGLKTEDIERVIGKVKLQLTSSSNPKAPGQLQSHYAPRKKLIAGDLDALTRQHRTEKTAILSFQKNFHAPYQFILSPSGNMDEAARNFFAALRALDESPADLILAEFVPDNGLGKAINDRLRRASFEPVRDR
ncbi:MAG TPA: Sua5 family C-terminal domain-containing protein, partial [Chryseosolibacter sp.]